MIRQNQAKSVISTLDKFSKNKLSNIVLHCIINTRIAIKSLEQSHSDLQLLKKIFYSVLILHLLEPPFSVFHVFQALIIFCFS